MADTETYRELNKLSVDVGALRLFLASLTNDGVTSIPLADLLHVAKVYATEAKVAKNKSEAVRAEET